VQWIASVNIESKQILDIMEFFAGDTGVHDVSNVLSLHQFRIDSKCRISQNWMVELLHNSTGKICVAVLVMALE